MNCDDVWFKNFSCLFKGAAIGENTTIGQRINFLTWILFTVVVVLLIMKFKNWLWVLVIGVIALVILYFVGSNVGNEPREGKDYEEEVTLSKKVANVPEQENTRIDYYVCAAKDEVTVSEPRELPATVVPEKMSVEIVPVYGRCT